MQWEQIFHTLSFDIDIDSDSSLHNGIAKKVNLTSSGKRQNPTRMRVFHTVDVWRLPRRQTPECVQGDSLMSAFFKECRLINIVSNSRETIKYLGRLFHASTAGLAEARRLRRCLTGAACVAEKASSVKPPVESDVSGIHFVRVHCIRPQRWSARNCPGGGKVRNGRKYETYEMKNFNRLDGIPRWNQHSMRNYKWSKYSRNFATPLVTSWCKSAC